MRLRIIRRLQGEIDGVSLDQFRVGETYVVGTAVGSYLLALRAAVPVIDDPPADSVSPDVPRRRDGGGTGRNRPRKTR
jgi:hypothetical protein